MTFDLSRLTSPASLIRKQVAEHGRVHVWSVAAFVLFVVAIFFARGGKAPGLSVSPIFLGAGLAFASGVAAETFRKNLWLWLSLGFLLAWQAAGALFGDMPRPGSDFLKIGLLAAFFLFVAQTSQVLSTRRILWIIAGVGAASAFLSIVVHVLREPDILDRMIPLGRGGNPIPGAGALASALIATVALWMDEEGRSRRSTAILLMLAVPLVAALLLTQSRGPLVALGLALPLAVLIDRRGMLIVLAVCLACWLLVTGLVVFEPSIKAMICGSETDWCRPSNRNAVWELVRDQIERHPILGSGPDFRFPYEWLSHAHNGLFGIALYFGLVGLAASALMAAGYARCLSRGTDDTLRFFGLASLIFTFGYMGADLPNPFAFFNTHYLFMWFPILLVLARDRFSFNVKAVPARSMPGVAQRI
ncbi:O-antigen ligase family protein [Microvirga splendida]|uniref:O-antigen ligase family protein n=1 Tax=Microvirga splendida TaxID=2795727 RepID=A0ABS0XVZ7_9HYPH|nr:O-antigen ligase family protein [Microvirga splendida]MBJ6124219.1 O-antigen ligase family protein [Microvirga splendida]